MELCHGITNHCYADRLLLWVEGIRVALHYNPLLLLLRLGLPLLMYLSMTATHTMIMHHSSVGRQVA